MPKIQPKFAPLTLDFTFKRAFANEQCKDLLTFLLNAFLAEKLQHPIEETTIMNSQMLGEIGLRRTAVFDVYCKDATGARFVVEVQIKRQEHFIKRTFFYLCMVICSLAKKGRDFDIPKLYSISFLDFELEFGDNCTEVIQHLSIRNDKHPEVAYDMFQMIFVILPRFNKAEAECETIIDKLIFNLKNAHNLKHCPKNFMEKELRRIFKIAEISNFNKEELQKYEADDMNRWDYKATMDYAKKEAKAEGLEEGETRGIVKGETRRAAKIARNMLGMGMEPALVARCTNLPKKQVIALSKG